MVLNKRGRYNILYASYLQMICPFCKNPETKVTNKREAGNRTRRRRECLKCKKRFTTYEEIEKNDFYVIKKDGRREKFDINKLKSGIEKALEKRPVPKEKVDNMMDQIEEDLRKRGKEIKSSAIGLVIMKRLEKLDKVAYVRFASVYKDFKSVDDFKKEIRGL